MPKYRAISIGTKLTHVQAIAALNALTDEDLVARFTPDLFPPDMVIELAWLPDEPEHERLPELLRARAQTDLAVLYYADNDPWCDGWLAQEWDTENHLPRLTVLFDEENPDDEDEDGNAVYHHEHCNPVVRLEALNILDQDPPPPPARSVRQARRIVNPAPTTWNIEYTTTTGTPRVIPFEQLYSSIYPNLPASNDEPRDR